MTAQCWATSRPYSDTRFAGGQHYHRPAWGAWHLWVWHSSCRDAVHIAQAATLTGVAAALSSALPAIRVLAGAKR